jgi:hypothetical protein
MTFKARAAMAGLLMLLLAGSIVSATAYAESGPFWYHRETGTTGHGQILGSGVKEGVTGEGGKQVLVTKFGGTELEIIAAKVIVEGSIYNNANQAQAELTLKYGEPKLAKPELKGCEVKIGEGNSVTVFGHQAWNWNGEKKQLEEEAKTAKQTPSWIFLPHELAEGAVELPKEQFTTLTLSGASCGVLANKYPVKGTVTGAVKPGLEEYSASQTVTTSETKQKQHFWNGKAFIGVEAGLLFSTETANLIGETTTKPATQEVALFGQDQKVSVEPSEVKFGNAMSGSRTVTYTNNGPGEWEVPKLVYTVNEGKAGAVTRENECAGRKLVAAKSCNVIVKYSVTKAENYKAEMKLAPAPTVKIQAEA